MPKIAVLGAGGHTGKKVAAVLERRGADVHALMRIHAQADDRASVAKAIAGCDALVNLAGPFVKNGLAPILAARDEGIPYVDTTGEQVFMKQVRDAIRRDGPPVVNALAFEYAFGDLAAKAFFPEGGDALHVLYRPRSTGPSAGTKKSMLRVFAAPTLSYEDGRLVRASYGRYHRTFMTDDGPRAGALFAGGEVLTVPTHTPFRTVRTYFQSRPTSARVARAIGPLARVALRGPILRYADRLVDRRHVAPTNEKARGEIHLVSEPSGKHVVVTTPDPYAATAEVVSVGALRLVGRRSGGVMAPAQALDAAEMLDAMRACMPSFGARVVSLPS